MQSKQRISEEAFPPGAKLVWSEKENKLVLRVPKSERPPAPPAPEPDASATSTIDRVLGVPARQ
jgi:hypothetical protein